ncbi:lysophospholipase-like protein 1 isoform X2 [Arctopsyche grandis]|uniref:lysophospholipase-like protein 1 isoform X2 n=1 Tax=Arctopsyche grandis TaxID=121162 RepID=UPI00406D78C9
MSRLSALVNGPTVLRKHTGTVLFFHGSGSTAEDIKEGSAFLMRKNFSFPHLKVVFPNAPLQPYTPLDGELSTVWFDRIAIESSVPEKLESINKIGEEVLKLIKDENDQGIPDNRIIVGGLSMGGALALHAGLRLKTSLAGIFAISSFLNDGSAVYSHLKDLNQPELMQLHGAQDDLVPVESAKSTFDKLTTLGVTGKFFIDEYAEHMPNGDQLLAAHNWIQEKLPNR